MYTLKRGYEIKLLVHILYGCETWSHTMREEFRLRVFENRVLRIFGSETDEVTSEWRKLHNEIKLLVHNLYGCETWSHTMREEFRLRVFENIWV